MQFLNFSPVVLRSRVSILFFSSRPCSITRYGISRQWTRTTTRSGQATKTENRRAQNYDFRALCCTAVICLQCTVTPNIHVLHLRPLHITDSRAVFICFSITHYPFTITVHLLILLTCIHENMMYTMVILKLHFIIISCFVSKCGLPTYRSVNALEL